ncbi:TPA: hypothetical protein DEB72_04330 [Patescibacteria group bacterium]|nr:hypothetical protein [Patescibacteria group bacterium]
MKIGIVTNLYPPLVRGGAEWLTYLVAREFVKQGHQVIVITLAAPGAAGGDHGVGKTEEGVKVYRFNTGYIYHYLNAANHARPVRLFWHIQHLFNWPLRNQIVRVLMAARCDLIISSNLMGLSFNLPKTLKTLAKTYVHIAHDVQLLHPSGLFMVGETRGGRLESLYQSITRWLFNSPTVVVFPSQWLEQEYVQRDFFPNSRKIVLRNPSLDFVSADTAASTNKFNLLYVGQAEEHKGIFWLLETLKNINDTAWKLDLALTGQTGDRQRINRLVASDSRIKVWDNLPQEEINKKYQQAGVVVVPSLCHENAPVSILLALAAGTPVLASNAGGIAELVGDNQTGYLFKPGDQTEFTNKLKLLTPATVAEFHANIKNTYQPVPLAEYGQKLISFGQ